MSGPRASAELDAFADQVAAVVLDATLPGDVRGNARRVLTVAADADREGTPYPRAFDLLVQVYEGGYDHHALSTIMRADSVRGLAYMRELFERSERPPLCRWKYDGDHGWVPIGGDVSLPTIPEDSMPVDMSPSEREALLRRHAARRRPPECEGYDTRGAPWCKAGGYLFDG
ncbi:MAG: hypothetical protein J4F34_05505, partial [Gemmatimonadetes bacterium]|nr:hypothetical protein [Gemmatimonadota bacterium]